MSWGPIFERLLAGPENRLRDHEHKGYPVVLNEQERTLTGFVPASELHFALGKPAESENNDTTAHIRCSPGPPAIRRPGIDSMQLLCPAAAVVKCDAS